MKNVVFETAKGTFEAVLYENDAPITTANFIELVNNKFYDGLTFHRVIGGFVAQGGCPKGDGTGGSGKTIPLETTPKLKHDSEGVLAMARSASPDSASSQFYITLAPQPHLDMAYAVFGKVIGGMNVVKSIAVGDKIEKIYLKDV